MEKRVIDFQGVADLDRKLAQQLESYLQMKESDVAKQILRAIPNQLEKEFPDLLESTEKVSLGEAADLLRRKLQSTIRSEEQYDMVVKKINRTLWDYTEVLEGCVSELFQQIKEVTIDRWHVSISDVVYHVKDVLLRRMENLSATVYHLETTLPYASLKNKSRQPQQWRNWFFQKKGIDPAILKNLRNGEKTLIAQYEGFNQLYRDYMSLSSIVEEDLQQMKNYPILAILTMADQNLYIDLYRLLKILETKTSPKIHNEIVKALKQLTSIDRVFILFRVYLRELREALFSSSLEWKSLDREGENYQEAFNRLNGKVRIYLLELVHFIHTVSQYRLFSLKNDPNPYVRSRWGFTEWIVGPEPSQGRKLLQLVYAGQELQRYFEEFSHALVNDPNVQGIREYEAQQQMETIIHEMAQPFISRAMMKNRAEKLLYQLKRCNEIGSPYFSTIETIENILSRAMRLDWKYQVLIGFPEFHEIYHLHHGIIEHFSDPSHSFRLERFHELFDQIHQWIKNDDISSHAEEIELDMNDMKTVLQDFLATVQRAVREKSHDPFLDETARKYQRQLLEYRYVFSQFFSNISNKSSQGRQLRNQFLFVDQYFESVEVLMNQLKEAV